MEFLEKLEYSYNSVGIEIQDLKRKIRLKNEQIERLENRINKKREANWWGDVLIRPLMDRIQEEIPEIKWSYDRLVPMGMSCEVWVFGKYGEITIGVAFLLVGEKLYYGTFKKGYNADITTNNGGMCYPIGKVETILDYIREQMVIKEQS